MNSDQKETLKLINVEISGRQVQVPSGITAIKALWYTGQEVIHGVGCLGGVCGACSILYRVPGKFEIKYGLGCQIVMEEGMSFSFAPHIPSGKAKYRLEEIKDPKQDLVKYYPEAALCRNCNTCTRVCPQGIDVRGNIWRAVFGEFKQVRDETLSCVMCNLCVPVCIADISPNLVFVYARRSYNHSYERKAQNLSTRMADIQEGKFQADWELIAKLDNKEMEKFCQPG